MKDVKFSKWDKLGISIFMTCILLSALSYIDITPPIKTVTAKGTVSAYTTDTIHVYVDWFVEFKHRKQSKKDVEEMILDMNESLTEDITSLIESSTYQDIQILKEEKPSTTVGGVTIILFNE